MNWNRDSVAGSSPDERIRELEEEVERLRKAVHDYASHQPIDMFSPRRIQSDLLAICGTPHIDQASSGSDECLLCGRDLRHPIHRERAVLTR